MNLPRFKPRQFLAADFDLLDAAQQEQVAASLRAELAAARTGAELETWLDHYGELEKAADEAMWTHTIKRSQDVTDTAAEQGEREYDEKVSPWLKPLQDELRRGLVQHAAVGELPPYYDTFLRAMRGKIDLFRPENVERENEDKRLQGQYGKIVNVQVPFEGKQWTFKALAQVQEDPDRARRQAAWEAVRTARAGISEKLEDLFDQQLKVRDAIAKEAGFANYRDYIFVEKGRFDYKPEDTLAFHEQVERHVVPFLRELQRERKEKLGVETLRPWDTKIDVQGDQPLRPFQTSEELFEGVRDIFSKLDPELGERFAEMKKTGLLDLENRPGKAPGAYSQVLAETGWPFTFMSAVGTQSDVTTLIHEGGHDQQAIATRDQRLFYYMLEAGMFIEFAEVASMGMEQLAVPHLDRFYGPEDARRAKLSMVERPVEVLPWIAAIDSFQQWAYTNVDEALDHKKRREKWGELTERFGGGEDWSGYEDRRTGLWLDQPHVFVHPLYYVEYAYAQDGALQILQNSLKDPEKAVRDYRAGIALGSSKPLPELFEATGIRFDKRGEMLESIMGSLREARVAMLPQAAPRKELGGLDFQRSAVAAPIETPQRKLDKV